jgi:hypothetical protein
MIKKKELLLKIKLISIYNHKFFICAFIYYLKNQFGSMNSRLTSQKITRSDRDNNSKPNSNKQYQTNIHKPSGILIQLQ